MKLLLAIAIVAILAVVVLAMQRSGPRVTKIDREVDREDRDA
ncbi:MAG TPA: hypothetical protein VHN55_06330 [Sphingomicrobium sp.]|nr:hypothetical protein [Sphingomicrobium sp.]